MKRDTVLAAAENTDMLCVEMDGPRYLIYWNVLITHYSRVRSYIQQRSAHGQVTQCRLVSNHWGCSVVLGHPFVLLR